MFQKQMTASGTRAPTVQNVTSQNKDTKRDSVHEIHTVDNFTKMKLLHILAKGQISFCLRSDLHLENGLSTFVVS